MKELARSSSKPDENNRNGSVYLFLKCRLILQYENGSVNGCRRRLFQSEEDKEKKIKRRR